MNFLKKLLSQLFGSNAAKRKAKEQQIVDAALPAIKEAATNAVVGAIQDHPQLNGIATGLASQAATDAINNLTIKI